MPCRRVGTWKDYDLDEMEHDRSVLIKFCKIKIAMYLICVPIFWFFEIVLVKLHRSWRTVVLRPPHEGSGFRSCRCSLWFFSSARVYPSCCPLFRLTFKRYLLQLLFNSSLLFPCLTLLIQVDDGSLTFLPWVVAIFSVGEIVGANGLGWLADKLSTKAVLIFSLFVGIAGQLVYATALNPWMILVGRVVTGIWTGIV